jgi:hypothetical protein
VRPGDAGLADGRRRPRALLLIASLVALVWAIATLPAAQAQVPQLVNYQGKLTNADGTLVADGDYSLTFGIYTADVGGTLLWSETQTVTITNGLFHVLLGSVNPIPYTLFSQHAETYLGIQVGSNPEMVPRERIASAPYALQAYGASGIPSGGIIMWSGSIAEIPAGWALCDGTNGTPDLRDRFVLGAGSTYAVGDTGGAMTHTHTVNIDAFVSASSSGHTHTVDPAPVTSSASGAHSHSVDPPSTGTSSAGSHSHSYSGTTAAGSPRTDYYTYAPDGYTEIHDDHTHSYSGTTSSAGGHSHSVDIGSFSSGSVSAHTHSVDVGSTTTSTSGAHTHTVDPPPAESAAASNAPPYYALAYIMKL